MPFKTTSFNNSTKRSLYFSLAVLCFVLVFPMIFQLNGHSQTQLNSPKKNSDSTAGALLKKAETYISLYPDSAESIANKVLESSHKSNEVKNIAISLNLLGKIKTLKGNLSLAQNLYDRALTVASKNQLKEEECKALLNIGEIIYTKGEYDKALILFKQAKQIAVEAKFELLESYALYYMGKFNHTKGNYAHAKYYYNRSLEISRKKRDIRQLAIILPSLGKQYMGEGNLNLALSTYQEAFRISTQLKDQLLSADICNHLGGLYLELKEFKTAMEYHKKALQYRLYMKYPGELAKSYNNIGKIYLGMKNLDSAKFYFSKSLLLCKGTDYKKGLIKSLINLGGVYRLDKQLSQAKKHLFEAYDISLNIGYDNGVAESGLSLGDLFLDANMPDTAATYYKISLDKLIKTNYNEDLLRVYKGLYHCYVSRVDFKKALEYHTALLEIEKRLLNVENKRQLAILNITFDTERKEKDYKVLLKDNELKASLLRSKNTLIWLIIVALGFAILFCFFLYNRFYTKKRAHQKLEELNLDVTNKNIAFIKLNKELEAVSKEKDKLFSIISHELRNPLYWLQNLAEVLSKKHHTMAPDKVSKTLSSIDESAKNVYHLMDNLLHWSRSQLNRVHPKKSSHRLYTLIAETTHMYESFFTQKGITFHIEVPNEIIIYADSDLFACVVRNLISNAIKYTPDGGGIRIDCETSENFVQLIVSDSGRGMDQTQLNSIFSFHNSLSMPGLMQEKGSGLGLRLCKDFVEINGGRIWVESTPLLGTRFFFTVLLDKQNSKTHKTLNSNVHELEILA